jgi:prolyl oligopeptidase
MKKRHLVNFVLVVTWLNPATFSTAATRIKEATGNQKNSTMKYPQTRRVDQVDEYHGVRVADPYRWLEADVRESDEVAAWVNEQNAVARKFLDAIPERPAIVKRLTALWNYERYSPPMEKGGKYFYSKNDGLQNQPVLYVADSYKAEGRVLLDPNTWSKTESTLRILAT